MIAGSERPDLVVPKLSGASLTPIETRLKPLNSNGIGDVVNETIQYIHRYRLIADRSGTLSIPPFVARKEGRSGATKPATLEVREPPVSGRPASFTGGVGAASVSAEVVPNRLSLGQRTEWRIRLDGPGARGAMRSPDVRSAVSRANAGASLQELPEEVVSDPPSRVYRYRLRPGRAGRFTLPPIAVATFNPRNQRYETKTTAGIAFTVIDVPSFDPSRLSPISSEPGTTTSSKNVLRWSAVFVVLSLAVSLGFWIRHRHGSSPARLARLTQRLGRGLSDVDDPKETARRVEEALGRFLSAATGRPPGVLTPDEAEGAFASFGDDPETGRKAAALVRAADKILYSGSAEEAGELARGAGLFFEDLAKTVRGTRNRREKGGFVVPLIADRQGN